jgi:hypothetical protein
MQLADPCGQAHIHQQPQQPQRGAVQQPAVEAIVQKQLQARSSCRGGSCLRTCCSSGTMQQRGCIMQQWMWLEELL